MSRSKDKNPNQNSSQLVDRVIEAGLNAGEMRFYSIVDSGTVAIVESFMDYALRNNPSLKEFSLHMSSPGGDLYAALGFYDYLESLKARGIKVNILNEGLSASAACMVILQGATKRCARPHTRYLLHELRDFRMGYERESEMEDSQLNVKALSNEVIKILADRSGRSPSAVKSKFRRRETWMSAQEALDWNLIDKIIP